MQLEHKKVNGFPKENKSKTFPSNIRERKKNFQFPTSLKSSFSQISSSAPLNFAFKKIIFNHETFKWFSFYGYKFLTLISSCMSKSLHPISSLYKDIRGKKTENKMKIMQYVEHKFFIFFSPFSLFTLLHSFDFSRLPSKCDT